MIKIEITCTGTAALLMHNERLANPFDELTRKIAAITSKKKNKTDQDNMDVQRLEWEGGLYHSDTGPYIPGANLKKCFMEAGTIYKAGTSLKRALTPLDAEIPLLYKGPRDVESLWSHGGFVDIRSVKLNGRSKVMRSRPKFPQWALSTTFLLNEKVVGVDDFERYAHEAGQSIGLGDYRPTFGRFTCQVEVKEF